MLSLTCAESLGLRTKTCFRFAGRVRTKPLRSELVRQSGPPEAADRLAISVSVPGPKGDLQALGRQVATDICREAGRRQYALTAVTAAVQDRLGEDIVLVPRAKRFDRAVVYSANFAWHGRLIPRHIVCYHIPSRPAPERLPERLLRVVLDIAHELGHLILEEGPGRCHRGPGITPAEQRKIDEIEADWFALCILQIYGFVFPRR